MNRRSWLRTAAGLLVAPAIVRAESLMPVRQLAYPTLIGIDWGSVEIEQLTIVESTGRILQAHWSRPDTSARPKAGDYRVVLR